MFIVVEMRDTVRIPPHSFNAELRAISAALDEKYSNKIIKDVGLAISLYEVVSIGEQQVYPGDGGAHVRVAFKLVVFRPFVGEILHGTILSCNESGLRVTLGFFDDIFIFAPMLRQPSFFDQRERLWKWNYEGTHFTMHVDDKSDMLRFRVNAVLFPPPAQQRTTEATSKSAADAKPPAAAGKAKEDDSEVVEVKDEEPPLPMQIFGSLAEDGLGMASWWQSDATDF